MDVETDSKDHGGSNDEEQSGEGYGMEFYDLKVKQHTFRAHLHIVEGKRHPPRAKPQEKHVRPSRTKHVSHHQLSWIATTAGIEAGGKGSEAPSTGNTPSTQDVTYDRHAKHIQQIKQLLAA